MLCWADVVQNLSKTCDLSNSAILPFPLYYLKYFVMSRHATRWQRQDTGVTFAAAFSAAWLTGAAYLVHEFNSSREPEYRPPGKVPEFWRIKSSFVSLDPV